MHTAAISYRVIDFLKQYPPFQGMEEADLLALARQGRVKFHEIDEYLCWQKAAHGPYLLVIQQGSVALWEEGAGAERLRDIRGAGDVLGLERFAGAPGWLYSAKATGDVVIYALPAVEFEPLIGKYPQAARYVEAQISVASDYQAAGQRRGAEQIFLHDLFGWKPPRICSPDTTIREAARRIHEHPALAVIDAHGVLAGVLTGTALIRWIAEGNADREATVETLMDRAPLTAAATALVSDGVVTMAEGKAEVIAVTTDGTRTGAFQGLAVASDVTPVFGDQPFDILREIKNAATTDSLAALRRRSRLFILDNLHTAGAVEWLARFANAVDRAILRRAIRVATPPPTIAGGSDLCICFHGAAGRGELLTGAAPALAVIFRKQQRARDFENWYEEWGGALGFSTPRLAAASVASLAEWKERFQGWVSDPVRKAVSLGQTFFDLKPATEECGMWDELRSTVREGIRAEPDFIRLLANDCLANLPPLTFYQDVVVDDEGSQREILQLERSALRPLVDVGRVFGMAAGHVLGGTTLDRLAVARALLPSNESVFREAAETLRIVLFHQARAGIRQGTSGDELAPALLSRQDRQVLKTGFRSILRLLEFTADCQWLERV